VVAVGEPIYDGDPDLHAEAQAEREKHEETKAGRVNGQGCDESGGDGDDAEIARLASLSQLDYARERKVAAKQLGCTMAILDRLVKAARGDEATGQGRSLDLTEPSPWPEEVDGNALLDEIVVEAQRYVVLDRYVADAVALWALAAHAFDSFFVFPRLLATAQERQCGKSTLLDLLSRLVPRPLAASNITAAALFRTIESARQTLLLDEADTYARKSEDLRGVIDAGHRRDGAVIRTVGDNHEPRRFLLLGANGARRDWASPRHRRGPQHCHSVTAAATR
jgi:putative DNA primase/helicase